MGGSYTYSTISQWVFESAGDYMESKAEYTANGNYLTKVTGSDGKSTTYSYDTTKGNLSSVTEPGNVTTSYTYNSSNDLLTKVAQSGSSVAYTYAKRKLSSITSPNGTKYTFTYDSFNRCTKTSVGSKTLATNTYDSLGRLTVTTYGNGDKVENVYDKLSRTTSVKYDGVTKANYTYDNDGNISKIDDKFSNIVTSFRYDSIKRPVSMKLSNGYTAEIRYDDKNRVESTVQNIGSGNYTTTYNYNREGIITDAATEYDGERVNVSSYEWDDLYRITYRAVEVNGDEVGWQSYTYKPGTLAGSTTGLVSSYSTNGNSFGYTYDDRGNIIRVTNNGTVEATYTYDSFDRLVSETANGVTTTWTYDANGNILTRTSNGTTVNYTYGDSSWKDLLTNYNGQAITYDAIGNPTKWGSTTYSWDAGRRLMTLSKSGVSASFTYDINGYRTAKTVNGVTTTYYLDGGTITALKKGTDELIFIYDEKGMINGFYHNGEPYVYVKNLQGDIIGIVDINYDMVVSYKYDAWGKQLSVTGELAETLGKLNPFRYRGYVYDDETGLYYLNSRYYDAGVGRFLNADGQLNDDIFGNNLFAYCGNNPVTRADNSGQGWWIVAGAIVGFIAGGVTKAVSNVATGKKWHENILGAAIGGAVYGGIVAATGNVWAAGFASAAVESITNEVASYTSVGAKLNGQPSVKEVTTTNVTDSVKTVMNDTVVNGTVSAVTGKIAGKLVPTNKGWFKPQKFKSCFVGKYAKKSELQTLIQSGLLFGVENVKHLFNQGISQGQKPTVTFFPETQPETGR